MKAVALLALRLCTGLYLLAWAAVKFAEPQRAIEISDKFYGGQFSNPVGQMGLGLAAGVVGIFVVLGFLRAFSYSAQALFLGFGAAAVGKAVFGPLIDHFDVAAFIDAGTDFLPSLVFFVASLLPFVFWKEDFIALDLDEIGDKTGALSVEATAIAAAPVLVAAAGEEPASDIAAEPEIGGEQSVEPAEAEYAAEAVEAEARPSDEPVPEEQAMEAAAAAEDAVAESAEAEPAEAEPAEAEYAAEAVEVEARPSDEPVPEEQAMEEAAEAATEAASAEASSEAPTDEASPVVEAAHVEEEMPAEAADATPSHEDEPVEAVSVEEASGEEASAHVEEVVAVEAVAEGVPVAEASIDEAAIDEALDDEHVEHVMPVVAAEESAAHTVH